ncbi:flagellar export chaperone FliS, partial [Burkholderia pseudomallei]
VDASEPMRIEVDGLLATLEDAWTGIAPEVARMTAQAVTEQAR